MEYEFLKNLNCDQLEGLKKIIESNPEEKAILLTRIINQIQEINTVNSTIAAERFDSSRMPYYAKENESACNKIMSELKFRDVPFFLNTFRDCGNAYGSLSYGKGIHQFDVSYSKKICSDLSEVYDISPSVMEKIISSPMFEYEYGVLTNPEISNRLSLIKIEDFFENEDYIYGYEFVYNTYNYIKNYVCQILLSNEGATKEDIIASWEEKQIIVEKNIVDIAKYLLKIRSKVNGKISVCNSALKKTVQKKGTKFSATQKQLIEAVAFGTTLEKLEVGNYEDSKRLIYLPSSK